MSFSTLICTDNRSDLLRQVLWSLVQGTVEKPDQIVVVNGGNHLADDVVHGFVGYHGIDLQLIKTVNKNLAASRNIGLPHCTGDIIAMTDDDAQVFPDWVTQMKRAHREHPEAGAVGGSVIGTNTDTLVGRVADLVTFPSWPDPCYVRTLPGVNISYKREAIEKVGFQDESLFRGEDVDFNWRVKQLGFEIYFDPQIKVHHHHRPTLKALLNQHYMYGRAYYLVRRKWSEMYCVYPHRFLTVKDMLKTINFFAALAYEPILSARKMASWKDTFTSLPLLFAASVVWKGGMVVQRLKHSEKKPL